jgi:hypothetical protein
MITVGGSQIAANSAQDSTFVISPATVRSRVIIGPVGPLDSSWAGLVWHAWFDAPNTLKVRVMNVTSLPVTPAAQSFWAQVFQDAVS